MIMKAGLGLVSALLLVSGCLTKGTNENKIATNIIDGDTCLINVSGIEFTKSFNHAKHSAKVETDRLILTSPAKSDYFNEPDGKAVYGNAPVLLTRIDNMQPFTFQVKVTPTFTGTYDAGALYIYQDPKWWFKFALEQDERKKARIVTVRTMETSDDNNHDVVDSASVFMKISSDVKTIGFYYSVDEETWQLVRLFKNDYPKELWLGLSAQSPIGNGNSVVFEKASLTPTSVKDFRLGN
jgi:regulation of enolase protein 1 (concanavalin A-like superfamily)